MKPINLTGFENKFISDDDPWRTFSDRDEAHKRRCILHGLGPWHTGRLLELAAGNGSNSVALARRTLRLDVTEGTAAGTSLIKSAMCKNARVRVKKLVLPGRFPRAAYDAAVVAEILYYLSPRDMARVARDLAHALAPGARLVLAHHDVDYPDFVQHAKSIHRRFLTHTGALWQPNTAVRTGRWQVQSYVRGLKRRKCAP